MDQKDKMLSNEFYKQLTNSIQNLNELAARLDERVKNIGINQIELETKLDKLSLQLSQYSERLALLEKEDINKLDMLISDSEKRIIKLETIASQYEGKWQKISGFVVQLVYAIITCYILYKMGFNDLPPWG